MQWLGLQLYGFAPNEGLVLRGPAKRLAQEREELIATIQREKAFTNTDFISLYASPGGSPVRPSASSEE